MINLLPPELKETYRYGRRNHALAGWIAATLFCIAGAILLVGGGYLYIDRDITATNSQIADIESELRQQNQATIQKQITEISNNLKLATEVLSKEVLFSKLLKQLGAVTPSNVTLNALSITQTTGSLEITAGAADYTSATQFQANLTDPKNQIFQTADIESIDCNSQDTTGPPCKVNIRALFANNSPFMFTADTKGTAK